MKFLLPFGDSEKIEKFRFDPNEIKDCKIDIQDISYIYCDKKFYRLPLEKIKSNLYTGISYASISSDKASMVALHNDPSIVIDMKNMVEFRPLLQSKTLKYFVYLLLFSIVAWIILLHCLSKQLNDIYPVLYKVIKITAPVIYVLLSIGIFYFLWIHTVLLGKVTGVLVLLCGAKYLIFKEWRKERKPEIVKPNFDWGMHYFRAIAIGCICLGHTFHAAQKGSWSNILFQADSIYFLFISGYLAQYLFAKKEESPLLYYKKKILNVIIPYIIFSSLVLIYVKFTHPAEPLYQHSFTIYNILSAFLFGKAVLAYWYIPFVSILFLLTPLFIRFSSKNFMISLFIFGSLAIIFPQRGGFETFEYFIYLYTYFTFSYLLGMAFSRYRETMETFFHSVFYYAFCGAIFISVLLSWNPEWKLIISHYYLLCSLQKILFVISFIVILSYLKNKKIPLLSSLAEYSFTIYFIHLIFFSDYQNIYNIAISFIHANGVVAVVTGIAFIFYMLFLSILLKKILGKHSRYFIGS